MKLLRDRSPLRMRTEREKQDQKDRMELQAMDIDHGVRLACMNGRQDYSMEATGRMTHVKPTLTGIHIQLTIR